MAKKGPQREAWMEYRQKKEVLQAFCKHIASKYGWEVIRACYSRNIPNKGHRQKRRPEMLSDVDVPPFSEEYQNTSYYFSSFMEALVGNVTRFRATLKEYVEEPGATTGIAGASEGAVHMINALIREFSSYNYQPKVTAKLCGPYGPTNAVAEEILVRPSFPKIAAKLGMKGNRGEKAINYCVEGKLIIDINTIRNINRKKSSDEDREYVASNVVVVERFRTDKRRGYQYRVITGFMVVHRGFNIRGFSSHSELGALRACKTLVTKQIDKTLTGSLTA